MLQLKKIVYLSVVISCLMMWGNNLLAQEFGKFESVLNINSCLRSSNPAFLKVIRDSLIGDVNINYEMGKGDFVNYYSPNYFDKYKISTKSYNRLSSRTVVFGKASYFYKNGKNAGYTSFLDPYSIPFNFIEKDSTTIGDNKIEEYHLIGAISYQLYNKLNVGFKADYSTTSFVKFKDMRNINDILDLSLNTGLTYNINNNCLGISYTYTKYIENLTSKDYADLGNDFYALIDRGSFMGKFTLYGTNGILKTKTKRPWVDISNKMSMQYRRSLRNQTFFLEYSYTHSKGHYGNDSDFSIIYMKHSSKYHVVNMQLSFKKRNFTQIISFNGSYMTLVNKENLYNNTVTSGGTSVTNYYGDAETFQKKQTKYNISYNIFLGDEYFKAPWEINTSYSYNYLHRKSTYYPYFRKQSFYNNNINLGVTRSFYRKKTDISLKFNLEFRNGYGGDPQDGIYQNAKESETTPDYYDKLLYKEMEYLVSTYLNPSFSFMIARDYKKDVKVYAKAISSFTKPLDLKYLRGNFFSLNLSVGINF